MSVVSLSLALSLPLSLSLPLYPSLPPSLALRWAGVFPVGRERLRFPLGQLFSQENQVRLRQLQHDPKEASKKN